MAKLTIHETPYQTMIKTANAEEFVTDTLGRKIGVRKLKVLERINMLKLTGNGNSENLLYVSSVTPAFMVTSIDGDAVQKPANELQLNGLLQRLDEEGLDAVTEWMVNGEKEKNAEKTELKNG